MLSGHGRLGLHASFSIRSNQPGQMKRVGDREEAGTELSRATGGRMLVSALLAETGSQVGIERTRPISGASTRNLPPRQKVPGLQARHKDKKQLMLCSIELVPGTVLSTFFYQGFSSAH